MVRSGISSADRIVASVSMASSEVVDALQTATKLHELADLAIDLHRSLIDRMRLNRRYTVDLGRAWLCCPHGGESLMLDEDGSLYFLVNYVKNPVTIDDICVNERQARQLIAQLSCNLLRAAINDPATFL